MQTNVIFYYNSNKTDTMHIIVILNIKVLFRFRNNNSFPADVATKCKTQNMI